MNNYREPTQRNNTVNIDVLIGEKIKDLRLARGINPSDIATALQLNDIEYSQIEKGRLRENQVNLSAIAKILNVPVQNLMPDFTDSIPVGTRPTSDEGQELLLHFCQIRSPENRRKLIKQAKELAAT